MKIAKIVMIMMMNHDDGSCLPGDNMPNICEQETVFVFVLSDILVSHLYRNSFVFVTFTGQVTTGLYLGQDDGQNTVKLLRNATGAKCVQNFCAICTRQICLELFVNAKKFVEKFRSLQAVLGCWPV